MRRRTAQAGPALLGAPRLPLLVRAFDLAENAQKLALPDASSTACLNGVRVLSMVWIVLGHSFLMAGATAGYSNVEDIMDPGYGAKTGFFFAFVVSAQCGVDTSRRAAAGRAELLASFFGGAVWGNFRENANCGDPPG